MANFLTPDPHALVVQRAVLHHLRFQAQRELGPAALESLEFHQILMRETQNLLIALTVEIQAQQLDRKVFRDSKTVEFTAPEGWFDHLRHDLTDYQCRKAFSNCPVVRWYAQVLLFICWVLRPPAYATEERTVTTEIEVTADALFPQSSIIVRDERLGNHIVVDHLVRKETR